MNRTLLLQTLLTVTLGAAACDGSARDVEPPRVPSQSASLAETCRDRAVREVLGQQYSDARKSGFSAIRVRAAAEASSVGEVAVTFVQPLTLSAVVLDPPTDALSGVILGVPSTQGTTMKSYAEFDSALPLREAVRVPLSRLRDSVLRQYQRVETMGDLRPDDPARRDMALRQIESQSVAVLGVYIRDKWSTLAQYIDEHEAEVVTASVIPGLPAIPVEDEPTRQRLIAACG